MSTRRRSFSTAAALILAAMASPAFATKSDDTLRFGSQTTLPSLDKYFNSGNTAGMIAHAVWDMLLYRDPRTGELEPGLATAWRWIDDKTLELDLRDGVRFHNGAVFEADDVVYTLNFVADPKNKAPFERLAPWFARVEKVNPRRVRIFMKKVSPAAVAELASLDLPIYPHAYYAAVGPKGMGVRPIGTGPYRVTGYAPGKFVRLERNSAHFRDSPKPQPQISKIEIRFIPDAQTRVAEIVSGGLDLIVNVDRDQAEQLREIPNLQVISGETTEVARLVLSTLPYSSAPQLRDVRVRRAIMHAVDREAVAKHLVGENSRVLHALCHPLEFGCDDSAVPRYAYDPSRAKRLLAEAGYPNGFDLDLYAIRDRNQVEAIIGYLRAIGIRARLRYVQIGAMTAARRSGRAPLISTDWIAQTLDISHWASVFYEFGPSDVNRDPELRDALLQGDSSMDSAVRQSAYARALRLISERAYALPLYSTVNYSY